MDKVAVSCEEPSLESRVEPRFGRAPGFLAVDPETMEFEYIDNGVSQSMPKGAGIQAAELVARSGAKVVLSGYVGPKAFQALTAAGIKVIQNVSGMTVKEAIEKLQSGELEYSSEPNAMGHGR
jgi:predicted Fe-Mo cluster-binding NifX family protein